MFGEASPEFECKIANLHLGEEISSYGDEILTSMEKDHSYDLSQFFIQLSKYVFPAKHSSVYLKYEDFEQGELGIVEYGRVLRCLSESMECPLWTQCGKFIRGLKDKEIRETLKRTDVDKYDFQGLIQFAVYLENNLERDRRVKEKEEQEKGEQEKGEQRRN